MNSKNQCAPICILQGTDHEQCRWKPIDPEPPIVLTEDEIKAGMVIGNKSDCPVPMRTKSYHLDSWEIVVQDIRDLLRI